MIKAIKKKKLLLSYPNQRWEKEDITTTWNLSPSVLCLLAEMVKDEVDVKIVDAQFYDLSVEDFKKEVRDYQPDYVGISVLTSEYENTLDISVQAVKEINPDIINIVGGVHATIEYKKVMENPNVDYVVRGEGEYTIQTLIRYLTGASTELPTQGLVYRKEGKLEVQNQTFVPDLAKLPWPDYSLVKFEDYLNTGARSGPLRARP